MTYLNIVYKAGYQEFARRAAKAGARAVIVPDLPLENSQDIEPILLAEGIVNIRLVAPNTSDIRLGEICRKASSLVYAVARSGVTGSATEISNELKSYTERIRSFTGVPIGLGFGIRTPADIGRLKGVCDYAIIGTAALQAWQTGGDVSHREFWQKISAAAKIS